MTDANPTIPIAAWVVLAAIVAVGVGIDLFAHRGERGQSRRSALIWSAIWIGTALLFGGFVAMHFGRDAGEDYLTAFVVEKSLSIDNLFVFLVVFKRLRIPQNAQHRVLQWGIVGAFVTRGLFIAGGSALLASWHGVIYVLGAFLVYTGIKTAREKDAAPSEDGRLVPFLQKHLPFLSPFVLAVIVIELTDVFFAFDSIPAVFAITKEPFLVYSSNIFALLGLRALYGVLSDLLERLKYLRYGLGAILVFTGTKMLLADFFEVPRIVSLLAIVFILAAVVVPFNRVRRALSRALRRERARAHRSENTGAIP